MLMLSSELCRLVSVSTGSSEGSDMKTDKELLELAAKAAGYNIKAHEDDTLYSDYRCSGYWGVFNPLTDDGDALRLAVKLQLDIVTDPEDDTVSVWGYGMPDVNVKRGDDQLAATRRAIVRAAAAIGSKK